jgi:Protein of unknown function (DUF692)
MNSALSSVQFAAYKVAAMPLAAKPATAPARPGLDGAPHRSAASREASGPIESKRISVRHKRALSRPGLSARFRALLERYEPALVSEHLAWSFNDLLPLPYAQSTLAHVCEHIDEVQNAIGRRILIENSSTYVAFASSTMSETDFIRAITRHTASTTSSSRRRTTAMRRSIICRIFRSPRWTRSIWPATPSRATMKVSVF